MMRISSSGADIGAAQECGECGPRYTVSLAGQVTTLLHPPVDVLQATADPICSVSARYKFSTLLWVSSFHIVPARSTFLLHSHNNAVRGSAGLCWAGVRSHEDPVQYQDECGEQWCYCYNYLQSIPLIPSLSTLDIYNKMAQRQDI